MMTAVVERRPWLPAYRVIIFDAKGRVFAKKRFWTLSGAREYSGNFTPGFATA